MNFGPEAQPQLCVILENEGNQRNKILLRLLLMIEMIRMAMKVLRHFGSVFCGVISTKHVSLNDVKRQIFAANYIKKELIIIIQY